MPHIPYAIETVHVPTDPPITWPIVVVAAECDDPTRLTRQINLPGIPLQLHADRSPKGLEPLLERMEEMMKAQCRRLNLRLVRFIKPHQKLSQAVRDRQVATILDMITPKIPGGKMIVQGRPN